ncbi:ubiquitin conjugating enzyme E2 [Coprinopsis cinerea okayama7|uniref:Ubiquitin conjugating enzyme E2 n=1 Tax=Coprinopsis cinerea (strain Okayama-7 / 130 / ATCC MYA-4618 / FGSC 9003) TaxID=240176 RepID=A8NLT7_COPC7|nr:ubiquitin conjugating enzyme E2 [Coprinopsis cinerea okayama7\|eukprot:XP_001834773.2 ubiquitin conjugating enzyme E2 [Coprinopsis cinerea okayama7\
MRERGGQLRRGHFPYLTTTTALPNSLDRQLLNDDDENNMPPRPASAMTMKRIHREIADIQKEDLGGMKLAPSEDNVHVWKGTIPGPEGSVYEGGLFDIEVILPSDYPFSAPKAMFKTKIYHMNVRKSMSCVTSIYGLDCFPSIATQYTRNRKQHDSTAREWTAMYAKPKPKPGLPPASRPPAAPARATTSSHQASGSGASRIGAAVSLAARSLGLTSGSASTPASASSSAAPSGSSTPVVIDLSSDDDAVAPSSRSKRKRPSASATSTSASTGASSSSSQPRRQQPVVVELLDSDSENEVAGIVGNDTAPSRNRKRRRVAPGEREVIEID